MNYANYHRSIVDKYHIQLIGLPDFEMFKDSYGDENAPAPKRQRTSGEGGSRRGAARSRGRVTQQLPRQPQSREVLTDTDDNDGCSDDAA